MFGDPSSKAQDLRDLGGDRFRGSLRLAPAAGGFRGSGVGWYASGQRRLQCSFRMEGIAARSRIGANGRMGSSRR